ncbi:hypothetical protein N7468_000669 [Penicillium chermesinum]|uniref:Rab proteins geranylgeranyltransferase n=1 Tax=Penicillium chermesinum TaxID=63820 RepID=A0A9W9PMG1_9EURO|nr:uncharacterized protein N7468_000669 [Penicillium chermesinum]KAJ5249218.1 hypothetical protein N7468_000669 [Penicillium chermesinum]
METLAQTSWDVIIAGTDLAQSLLALALSRSGKKILHLDQNQYYGGSEAAFSLDEAQEWMNSVNQRRGRSPFEDVEILSYQHSQDPAQLASDPPKLAASRAYTLSLSPYFLYTRSALISALLSSKVYRQLEFMAMGSWWIYTPDSLASDGDDPVATRAFHRVPGNREDVFADKHISMKSKRALMRFLRHISKSEDEAPEEAAAEDLSVPFGQYLSSNFSVPEDLHDPLISLSLSQLSRQETTASYAVPRVKRHLASIGSLGPGFGGVVSKYGCGSEILQVACRASAVGGGVYALDTGVQKITDETSEDEYPVEVHLSNGEKLRSKFVVGSAWTLSADTPELFGSKVARSVSVVSSDFASLFPVTVEGAPVPASALLMFPGDKLNSPQSPPVYLQIHSSDTGDCPRQQSIIYGGVSVPGPEGQALLESAVNKLIQAEGPKAIILWSLRYTQLGRLSNDGTPLDIAFEDDLLDTVKESWLKVAGDVDPNDFMIFDDREGTSDE